MLVVSGRRKCASEPLMSKTSNSIFPPLPEQYYHSSHLSACNSPIIATLGSNQYLTLSTLFRLSSRIFVRSVTSILSSSSLVGVPDWFSTTSLMLLRDTQCDTLILVLYMDQKQWLLDSSTTGLTESCTIP